MANRPKEDEKNERIIRGLLKLPANPRCINCNSLGPQYVCTNFWTFVCTNCSGIHREFTHRVKSISMAKFTSQEVSALQEGGNQRAKEVYFKEWDSQSHSLPDSSNVDRLRNFIKHVYVDRRFTGERTYDKTQRGDKDNFYFNRRVEPYQGGPKSPPYEDTYERRYNDRSSSGGRSPEYDQETRQYSNDKRSPGRPPIINDWRREDRFGDRRRFEDHRISQGEYKLEGQLPEQANNLGSLSPLVVRPVRDFLGEHVIRLRISEPPKTNSGKATDGSPLTQRTVSSSSLASSNGNPAEVKLKTTKSLIDFDCEPEPPVAPTVSHAQQITAPQSVVEQPNSSDDKNWASFDVALEAKATQAPSNVNTLESMLSQLSVSASLPAHVSQVQGGSSVAAPIPGGSMTLPKIGSSSISPAGPVSAPSHATAAGVATGSSHWTFPSNDVSVAAPGLTTVLQHQQTLFPPTVSQSSTQQFTPPAAGAFNDQLWNVPPAPMTQGHPSMSMPHASHLVLKPASETNFSVVSQPSVEVKPSGRKELPEDLFTVKYSSFPAPVPQWQMGPPRGMGISMLYNTVPMPSFQQPSKSTNPFDISNEPPPLQTPTFHSVSSLQGALASVSPSGVMHSSSLGNPSLAWNPQSSPYGSVLPLQRQPCSSAMAPRLYGVQQMPTNMAMPRHQENGRFGTGGVAFGFSNLDRQLSGTFLAPASSNLSSAGGNPFG